MEVLILTGACAVGKSTIARNWAKKKNGAIVECDYFTEWIFQKEFPHWTKEEEKFTAPLAAKTAIEYLKFGMPVAIENVWAPSGIELLMETLRKESIELSIKVVWLTCGLEINQQRDKERPEENQMKERVAIVNQELASYSWPKYVSKVDTSDWSIEETVAHIELSIPAV